MKYLLDSDVLSDFYEKLSPNHVKIAAKLASLEEGDEVCISVLTLYEFEYGCANASDDKKAIVRKRIEAAPEDFAVLPMEAAGARTYGELKKALTALGMGIAFAPGGADFTGIRECGGLWIDKVKHKTYVKVDEAGTEAAAVTVVVVVDSADPGKFHMRVDRPFLFAIREKHSGTVLFIGTIVNPGYLE